MTDLKKLQFGRGFDYTEPLMIGMNNIGHALQKQIVSQIYQMIYSMLREFISFFFFLQTNLQSNDQIGLRLDFIVSTHHYKREARPVEPI